MKLLALMLIALFAAVPILQFASALDILSYDTRSTFTSLAGDWERVWTNSTGFTYFVDINQGNFKSVIMNSTGHVVTTSTQTLSSATEPSSVSNIEVVAGVPRVYTAQTQGASSTLETNIVNVNSGAIISAANHTMTGTYDYLPAITQTANKVWIVIFTSTTTDTLRGMSIDRDLTNFTDEGSLNVSGSGNPQLLECQTGTYGAAYANDTVYCFDSTAAGLRHVSKLTSTTFTELMSFSPAANRIEMLEVNDKIILISHMSLASTERTGTIDKATDTIDNNHYDGDVWTNRPVQMVDFDGTTATYSSTKTAHWSNGEKAVSWDADGTKNDVELMLVDNDSGGVLTGVDFDPFYRISDVLIVSGSGTTWTPRYQSTGTTVNVDPDIWSERLSIPLVRNDTAVLALDVIRINCDTQYTLQWPSIIGDDGDCTTWTVLAESSATVGRNLTYSTTSDLIHADAFTGYSIDINISTPSNYGFESYYDDKMVDREQSDSSGQLQQRYLYGQCYDIKLRNVITDVVIHEGTMCANDFFLKTINFSDILTVPDIPDISIWNPQLIRSFNVNATTNRPIPTEHYFNATIIHNILPYNSSVYVSDKPISTAYDAERTYSQWFNVTNSSTDQIFSDQYFNATQTIYFIGFENGEIVWTSQLIGTTLELPAFIVIDQQLGTWLFMGIGSFAMLAPLLIFRENVMLGGIMSAMVGLLAGAFGLLNEMNTVFLWAIYPVVIGIVILNWRKPTT